jgi:FkbM family methyltransferase
MINFIDILKNCGIELDNNNHIILPKNIKQISIDVGTCFNAIHSENWLYNNSSNDLYIFGFEPNPNCVKFLNSRNKNNLNIDLGVCDTDITNIIQNVPSKIQINKNFSIIPVALSNVVEPIYQNLYLPEASIYCSSLLEPATGGVLGNISKRYVVPVFNLSSLFEVLPFETIKYINYLKIDVQGCDINVLKGAGNYLKKYVVYITAEPETSQYKYSEQNSANNIITYLTSNGFKYINHPNTQDPTFINLNFIAKQSIYIYQKH